MLPNVAHIVQKKDALITFGSKVYLCKINATNAARNGKGAGKEAGRGCF